MSMGKKFCLVMFALIGLTDIVADECEHGKHYQNIKDRQKFSYCSHGEIYNLSCSKGFYWNANISSCDFQSNVICPVVIETTAPRATATPTWTTPTTTTKLTADSSISIVCQWSNGQDFQCDCPFGYTGNICQHHSAVSIDCHMRGNGYIELNRSTIVDGPKQKKILIALMFSTNNTNGLLLWYGQRKSESYNGQDFVALAIVDGYLEYSFRLNGEEAMIKNIQTRVDEGKGHIAIIRRTGNLAILELDGLSKYGKSRPTDKLESYLPGHLFLGGAPDLNKFTGNRYIQGFNGCIHVIEGQEDGAIDLGQNVVSGLNVDQCPEDQRINDY